MSAESGKSKSSSYPFGKRRTNWKGEVLAPRSLRSKRKVHYLLKSCSELDLKVAKVQ